MSSALLSFGATATGTGITGELMDVEGPSAARESKQVTHQGSPNGWHEFKPSPFADAGEITVRVNVIAGGSVATAIKGEPGTLTVTDESGTESASAFCTAATKTRTLGEPIEMSYTFKLTGALSG